VYQNFSGAKGEKQRHSTLFTKEEGQPVGIPKLFRSKEDQTEVLRSFSGAKRNQPNYSDTFQDQSGTNQIVPKLFKIKQEQTKAVKKGSK